MVTSVRRTLLLGAVLVVTASAEDDKGKPSKTDYEGKCNPQVLVDWIKDKSLDPYEIYRALYVILTYSVDEAAKRIRENFNIHPSHIQIMLSDLKIDIHEAYGALDRWIKNLNNNVTSKSGYGHMSSKEVLAMLKRKKKIDEDFSEEEDFKNKNVPEALDKLALFYQIGAWGQFNQEAAKLRKIIEKPKWFFRNYTAMLTWKNKHQIAFRALRRFFVKGITAAPTTVARTTPTTPTWIGPLNLTVGEEDWRDLHDVEYANTDRYRLVYNETFVTESPVEENYLQLRPSKIIKNIRRYHDIQENKIVICEKTIDHADMADAINREIETKVKHVKFGSDLFDSYMRRAIAAGYVTPLPKTLA